MDLLIENLQESEGSFYEKLHQEGYFDNSLFAELILYIDGLNSRELTEIQRLRYCSQIWELAYRIQSSIGYSHNQNDSFEITNMDEEKLIEIGQVLEYICKSFAENRQLDMDFINEMT
ncbi:hypothetical protein GTQ34_16465 [Muricauda sp. JGD-17]|uniref:Uncharacterized protein n=1 Tax=Flagellimonas ochracea TaxID=2696472 RepID=A0A964WYZ7_9FLAO|nr:hypothetical protein [Allomuricauda ochracea]NAY93502.1 hypothetical protein [Allomuricauda ochracea]